MKSYWETPRKSSIALPGTRSSALSGTWSEPAIQSPALAMNTELTPPQAWDILQETASAVLLDVRSAMEYEYVGHPLGALHVALMEPPDWRPQTQFVERVRQLLALQEEECGKAEDRPVLVLCRSGKRSGLAAQLLREAGFRHVSNVLEGFEGDRDDNAHRNSINGWRFHNLPWEQS